MSYTRVTEEERIQIYAFRQAGKGNNEIAVLLGRDKSTISREVRRNMGQKNYRYVQAQRKAEERAKRPGPRRLTDEVKSYIHEKLKLGWTPEQISGRARLEGLPNVCKETIYKYIYDDAKNGGGLWKLLPRAKRKRKRRCPRVEGRGRGLIPNRRCIDTRPAEVELRTRVGHWEGDLVVGANGSGYLITLVERVTRYTLVGYTRTKEASEVTAVIIKLLRSIGVACTGITFDNGKEFSKHIQISTTLNVEVYFAHPYHSWERGTNENTNGLIRRMYPKSASFAAIGSIELQHIERSLNDRPRKCLDWKTPREVMRAFLVAAA